MYSYGPPHMAVQKQDDQHENTFSSYVRIRDVVLKTCLGRWTIGRSGERGSGISVLPARHDDDDEYYYLLCSNKLLLIIICQYAIRCFYSYHYVMFKYFIKIIIIFLSRYQDGYPWPSLATPLYHSSLLAGPRLHPVS